MALVTHYFNPNDVDNRVHPYTYAQQVIGTTYNYTSHLIGAKEVHAAGIPFTVTFSTSQNPNFNTYRAGFINNTTIKHVSGLAATAVSMANCFQGCTNLISVDRIPDSFSAMQSCFSDCTNLVNAPSIPNSVTNMSYAFQNCTNLVGDIYIYSNQIMNAVNCFKGSDLYKTIYIPFTYANNEYTQTYNSFIAAGYNSSTTSANNAHLADLNGRIITQEGTFDLPKA